MLLTLLHEWDSFYVIIGSSAAALTGLMFVVIALMTEAGATKEPAALEAFATPTIVHFSAVLLVAAIISMPHHSIAGLRWGLHLTGFAGIVYASWVTARAVRQKAYVPQLEDWIFHSILPIIAYASLFIASVMLRGSPEGALFGVAASSLLLLFVGIHNAWDSAVWMTIRGPQSMQQDERAIRETIDRWHRATRAGDLNSVLALMADDALFLTPGRPPMTKDAFASAFRKISGPIEQDIKEIRISGDLAYCWSHISVTADNKTHAGPALTIFRKREDGSWALSRDANLLTGGT